MKNTPENKEFNNEIMKRLKQDGSDINIERTKKFILKNKNTKVLKTLSSKRKQQIHQVIKENRKATSEKNQILRIFGKYYTRLY